MDSTPIAAPGPSDVEEGSTRVVRTACTLDCPDACSLEVTVVDGRIARVDASPESSFTDGWICSKVRRHAQRVYAPERVLHPLVRTGPKGSGTFRESTWDEAAGLIASRIRAAIDDRGPDAVVGFTYNSSAAAYERASATDALFARLGATSATHTICAHTVGAAWSSVFGDMASADPLDVVHSDLVVIWGANPTVSNTHLPALVRQAQARGAGLVVIDPRRTAIAERADLHLAVRPGTDVVLALAIAHHWAEQGAIADAFVAAHAEGVEALLEAAAAWSVDAAAEVCGLHPDDVRRLADLWSATPATMLRIGWGPERNANGGAACRAILGLPVLAGTFAAPGSGVIGWTRPGAVDASARWPEPGSPDRRSVDLHRVGEWMAPGSSDPCEVLFVQGSNPLVMCPDQQAVIRAFEREDVFVVVHDQVMTDTARYADVVLPATTSFEIDDVAQSYGTLLAQPVRRVIPPVGESRSNDETGRTLAAALGVDLPMATADLGLHETGPRYSAVPSRQFVDTWPHDGRARLSDARHGAPTFRPVPRDERLRPLTLISPATSKLVNSMFGEFQSPSTAILLHPVDAAARGLVAGGQVRVTSDLGSIVVPLDVHDATRPGVAVMAKGVWLRNHPDGLGVNALTPATGDPLAGGACFNDTFVEVTAAR
jgi:anaerobic selenocysteine-containing dehydrogenase